MAIRQKFGLSNIQKKLISKAILTESILLIIKHTVPLEAPKKIVKKGGSSTC